MVKRIQVTQNHIERGLRDNSSACAVALAVLDAFSDQDVEVEVTGVHIDVFTDSDDKWYTASTPWQVQEFIERFDNGELVGPIAFDANFKFQGDDAE